MNYKHCCSFQVKEVHLKKRDWGLAWFIASKDKFHTKFTVFQSKARCSQQFRQQMANSTKYREN